jgi:pyruvate dehydrogenase E1 component alpha subunit
VWNVAVTAERSPAVGREVLIDMYTRMVRIRVFEERCGELAAAAQFPGGVHLSIGEEATYVGAVMPMRPGDYMTGNHRSHGHPLAMGTDLKLLMAELYGKSTGLCKGKGGSLHLADFSRGSLGESGIVGAAIPVAIGAGLSAQVRGSDQVCIAFFGDGAVNEGIFHESVNLAGAWKLPVVFLCENNFFSVNTRTADVTSGPSIAGLAAGYGIPGKMVDGQDVLAVYNGVQEAFDWARAGKGPSLIESQTFRYRQHSLGMVLERYGWDEELESWMARDPIKLFAAKLLAEGQATQAEFDAIKAKLIDEVDAAVQFAKDSPAPEPEEAFTDNYGPSTTFTTGIEAPQFMKGARA